MAEFVVSVLLDIIRHVVINRFKRVRVRTVNAGKLRVLLPEIRFKNFRRREEAQNRGVTFAQGAARSGLTFVARQQSAAGNEKRSAKRQISYEGAAAKPAPG